MKLETQAAVVDALLEAAKYIEDRQNEWLSSSRAVRYLREKASRLREMRPEDC